MRSLRRNARVGLATLTLLAVLIGASLAQASTPWVVPTMPAGLADKYPELASLWPIATPPPLVPQGTLVVDSGFDPMVNGFHFGNYGNQHLQGTNLINTYAFGTPYENPTQLTPVDMIFMFGATVCTDPTAVIAQLAMTTNGVNQDYNYFLRPNTGNSLTTNYGAFSPTYDFSQDYELCTLTLQAEQWMDMQNSFITNGVCFGMAATAMLNFSMLGGWDPKSLGVAYPLIPLYDVGWSSTMTRTIARWQVSQSFTDYGFNYPYYHAKPSFAQTIEYLTSGTPNAPYPSYYPLSKGKIPYVLSVFQQAADGSRRDGHVVVPIAVYKRENDPKWDYDIAVYDPNYPGRTRAVHVNTTANNGAGKMEYVLFSGPDGTDPSGQDTSNGMQLVPSGNMVTGPFDVNARGLQDNRYPRLPWLSTAATPTKKTSTKAARAKPSNVTTVSVGPAKVDSGESLKVRVVGLNGKPIPGLIEQQMFSVLLGSQTFPLWKVPHNVPFRVVLSTNGKRRSLSTSVTVQNGRGTWAVENMVIRPKSRDVVTVRPADESISYRSTTGTDPTLSVTDAGDDAKNGMNYRVNLRKVRLDPGRKATLDLNFKTNQATLTTNQRSWNRISIEATIQHKEKHEFNATSYAPRAGEALTIDFSDWTAAAPTALTGWLATTTGARDGLAWSATPSKP